jgi:hypothetical protein
MTIRKITAMHFCFALMLLGFFGCVHSSETDSEITPELAIQNPDLPSWTTEDCVKVNNFYYFVGYGEGSNSSSSIRNALITSRQNALTCLFGGTITSNVAIQEDSKNVRYDSSTSISLDYSHVNWSGYEVVAGRTFFLSKDQSKIYVQYRWDTASIEKERARLDNLAKNIEESKALKEEVKLKKALIDEQRAELSKLQHQEEELAKIKNSAEKAVHKLKQKQASRAEKSRDILQVIENLYCGITLGEFIEVFRKPDGREIVAGMYDSSLSYIAYSWDQYQVRVTNEYVRSSLGWNIKITDVNEYVFNLALKYPIDRIYIDYGLKNNSIDICKR